MKLYACPGTCSLAPHIVLHELDVDHELCVIDLRKGEGQSPEFREVNPLGQVPTLVGEHGEVLTEVAAILIYLFQQYGQMDVPLYQSVRHLSFISSELHKNFYPQFFGKQILGEDDPSVGKLAAHFKDRLAKRWEYVDYLLPAFDDLDGAVMGPADPYLYTVCRWWIQLGHNFEGYDSIPGFLANMESRASVQKALGIEGLEPVAHKAVPSAK
jgi:glutathione S-transferase